MADILREVRRGIGEVSERGFEVKAIKLRPDVKERLVRDHLDLLAIEGDEEREETPWTLFGYPVDEGAMKEDFKIEFRAGTHVLELGPDEKIVKAHSYTHDGLKMASYQFVKREAAE
ncbi:hypothetical protein ABE387_05180 [Bacillus licheniformis]|uniref:hypothetical protein n=1 Tax=Bacillus licheniformis TaxID=1402 RepID=UPI002DBE1508|nr:hypothetical protein [Bacillus licheniformis]MEC1863145.1 hypothetical protein [Bacillus licheniformis]